ncbi:Cryparin [Cyphellophora attinorum]|uniref:Cryparin n=1 Tax=Cyphellophora attinorum TaxID=1664694 RepID=A0A0N0NLR5_9EURO|nr:Cryparin [Phialophora attinorum]KPI39611.1 Cryparin [Phialophora attinorum]
MQFFTTIVALAGAAAALPAVSVAPLSALEQRQLPICSGLTGSAQCCATDVLDLADLDCATPPDAVTTTEEFVASCSAIGQQARCCAIPILGQALICSDPVGFPGKQ